ncbi:hypothetical protein CBI38_28585 [Rhodococcus oxybenzonivorans]|uniref:Uncharacterized protein n=1 Tax=Rhodococcus oxybenzonivorans TaxID=1990687 RepID=A0A2S2C215_9NOCA|nr:hypothetical protein [Rhodococcus oxybenzonivorans]AWK74931.1 hypothetical protein CBI38_28585 [Rhodococcus oxybenzonivorans]
MTGDVEKRWSDRAPCWAARYAGVVIGAALIVMVVTVVRAAAGEAAECTTQRRWFGPLRAVLDTRAGAMPVAGVCCPVWVVTLRS